MNIGGWSPEGAFCWHEERSNGSNKEELIRIVDLVTDEILFEGPYTAADDPHGKKRIDIYSRYGIESARKGSSHGGNRLVYGGDLYEIDLFSESDRVSIRIKNVTRGTMKEVNTSPLGGDEMEIKGSVLSPYEKRAALVFLRKGSGKASYVVMGAHLTLGFAPIPLEEEELIDAVLNGHYYLCRLLLYEGADPDGVKDSRGYTPLLLAARNGKWDIARLLLEYGANPMIRDGEGKSPGDYAREAGETLR